MGVVARGEINNQANMNTIEFSGARFGNITPTDIDGFMEFGGKAFIFVEMKYKNAKLPFGQELALTRLCDAVTKPGVVAVLFVASWDSLNTKGNIGFADSIVTKIYMYKRWYCIKDKNTLKHYIDRFLSKYKIDRSLKSEERQSFCVQHVT